VGVGSADFKAMNALDCDVGLLKDDRGNTAKRDIVQFVAFRDHEYVITIIYIFAAQNITNY